MSTINDQIIPVHQWTNGGTMVRILRCGTTGYGGFQYPKSGTVSAPERWNDAWGFQPSDWKGGYAADNKCGAGLHGWAWGFAHGDGKEPIYSDDWLVIECDPKDVSSIEGGKVKFRTGSVIFCGAWNDALARVMIGLSKWCVQASKGASSATGCRSASSATGESSASSATGYRSIAAVTGKYSTVEASATGIAACTASECTWIIHVGAVLIQRWMDGDECKTAVLDSKVLNLTEGQRVTVRCGKIVN
jgi:hypothetical protein